MCDTTPLIALAGGTASSISCRTHRVTWCLWPPHTPLSPRKVLECVKENERIKEERKVKKRRRGEG